MRFVDGGHTAAVAFVDFRKAFNCDPHSRLLLREVIQTVTTTGRLQDLKTGSQHQASPDSLCKTSLLTEGPSF